MSGHDDDRQVVAPIRQLLLEVQTAQTRHAYVEDEARRSVGRIAGEEFRRRGERLDVEPDGADQPLQGLAHIVVVIDDENRRFLLLIHRRALCYSGVGARAKRPPRALPHPRQTGHDRSVLIQEAFVPLDHPPEAVCHWIASY